MALTKEADPIMTPTGCDVAIIGAGASGLAAAWLLASRGLSVVLLEQVQRVDQRAASSLTRDG